MRKIAIMGLLAALAMPPAASTHPGGAYWPFGKVIRQLDGTKIRIGRQTVAIDGAVTACTGQGRARMRRRTPAWTHFRCIEATLSARGRDVAFVVHVLGKRRFTVTGARFL